ncbi:MAG: glycoside hydrolase family 25 protein [Verrucomicrobiota bacterium]|nr:glycoside hydrolase family 25 protein [Verrucomicrobiota bacterium]
MKAPMLRAFLILQALSLSAFAANSVVNLSHYDTMRVDFEGMARQGIVGVIHESGYPRNVRDEKYAARQSEATRAGLLWGAYHYANASDPVRQADFFLNTVSSTWRASGARPKGILLVLDFEQNRHYPGGTMRVDQAVAFIQRVKQRTGEYPGLYSGYNRIRAILNNPKVTAEQKATLRSCWLWVANYHYIPVDVSPWRRWTMWQYTGDGVCDLPRAQYPKSIANVRNAERNIFNGSPADTRAFWESHAWHPGGPSE